MRLIKYCVLLLFIVTLSSCGKGNAPVTNKSGGNLTGAGATFPYPIYSKWFSEYQKINPDAKISYQSIGSGGGIKQTTEGTVDFGASDIPLTPDELKKAEDKNNSKLLQIPTVLGAVVLTYNLPGITSNINLSGSTIADIFLGNIKKWNDAKIKADNPGINFPDKEIVPCTRTDGSGTTYIFTEYLGKVSPEWKDKKGAAKDMKFPVGQGAKGNEGVTGFVKQLEYSIGYVELIYAIQNNLKYASVKNKEGEFISPELASVTKAADNTVDEMKDGLTLSVTDAKGKGSYPISSYTYMLIFENQKDAGKGKILKGFMNWALSDGKKFANDLGYASLPESIIAKAKESVAKINSNGTVL